MYIYEYHKEHGIVPKRAKVKHFATDTVMIKRQMTFRQISELLDVPVAQLQLLTVLQTKLCVPFITIKTFFKITTGKSRVLPQTKTRYMPRTRKTK
jgi:membrane-bound lytic murein transglycosylase D